MRNFGNFFSFSGKSCNFFTPLKHSLQELTIRQPTNFGIKNQSFITTLHIIADQFKLSGIERPSLKNIRTLSALPNIDFNECVILLTTRVCQCNMQWLLLHILDAVFIQAKAPAVFPTFDCALSVQISTQLFKLI
jgi:hypothetical protein